MPKQPPSFEQLMGRSKQSNHDRNRRRADRIAVYNSPRWQALRLVVLAEQPICAECQDAPATEVDHKEPLSRRPDLAFVRENLQGLCEPCHGAKTSRGE